MVKVGSQKDFWSGVLFVAIGVGFAWGATDYDFGSSARPGPAYFPFGLGILLALLGAALVAKALVVGAPGGDRIGAFAWRPLAVIVGAVIVFGVALPRLGLLVTLPLVVLASAFAGEKFRPGEVLLNALVLSAGSWAVFAWGLGLVIPLWPVFITG